MIRYQVFLPLHSFEKKKQNKKNKKLKALLNTLYLFGTVSAVIQGIKKKRTIPDS